MTLLSTVLAVGIGLAIAPATLAHPSTIRVNSSPSVTWNTSIAQTPPRGYTPPPRVDRTSSGGTTGGVRGQCSRQSGLSLLALAPSGAESTFATSRPTLAWFVPEEDTYSLVFQLFQNDAEEPLYDVEMTSRPGIMSWTLPADAPELTTGEAYRWRVILICNPNRPSLSVVDEAQFVVAGPPVTTASSHDSAAYINQMVAAGFWYDALALTLSDLNREQGRSLRLELLQDLVQIEEGIDAHRAENLRSMIDTERY
jgi:hypothetical protein